MRSLAAGAIIVGVVSVAAALTLMPALLSLLGDRVNSLRVPILGRNLGRVEAGESRFWRWIVEDVLRRPAVSLVSRRGLMIAAAVPLLGLHIGASGVTTLPSDLPSKRGYLALQREFPAQSPYPAQIVVEGGRADVHRAVVAARAAARRAIRASAPAGSRPRRRGHVSLLSVPVRGDAVGGRRRLRGPRPPQHLLPAAFAGTGAARLRRREDGRERRLLRRRHQPDAVRARLRARAQPDRADRRLPLARGRGGLDPAQPALGRRRLRPAHARLPATATAPASSASSTCTPSTPGCRCSSSPCCSGSRWTTRCS